MNVNLKYLAFFMLKVLLFTSSLSEKNMIIKLRTNKTQAKVPASETYLSLLTFLSIHKGNKIKKVYTVAQIYWPCELVANHDGIFSSPSINTKKCGTMLFYEYYI